VRKLRCRVDGNVAGEAIRPPFFSKMYLTGR